MSSKFSHARKIQPTPPVCALTRNSTSTPFPELRSILTVMMHSEGNWPGEAPWHVSQLVETLESTSQNIWTGHYDLNGYAVEFGMTYDPIENETNLRFVVQRAPGPGHVFQVFKVQRRANPKVITPKIVIFDDLHLMSLCVTVVC